MTTKQVQQFAGAAPNSVFAERWFIAEAYRSKATEDAAAVADVTFVDFEAALKDKLMQVITGRHRKNAMSLRLCILEFLPYVIKPTVDSSEPPHWVCTHCFEQQRKIDTAICRQGSEGGC